jgi:DNA-binding LacI/PurR family transcriptional regulator
MSAITIYEVAREANVSPSTVSNVLNGRTSRMHPSTHARVEAAIRRLNYSPNRAARQLRSGGIHTIGLVVPSVANPFWGLFASLFEGVALASGYGVLLCNSGRDTERESTYLEELLNDGVSGVVLGTSLRSAKHLAPLIKRGLRVVTLDRSSQDTDPKGLVDVSVDNRAGSALLADHLWELGHRRFAFVLGEVESINRQERLEGFTSALVRRGIPESDIVVWRGTGNADGDPTDLGRRAAHAILSEPEGERITAIATVNDMSALGVYRGVRDAGYEVGTDVAVVGFDDIPLAQLVQPTLTTVRQPLEEMAGIALGRLLDMINEPTVDHGPSVRLAPELIVRESTGFPDSANNEGAPPR